MASSWDRQSFHSALAVPTNAEGFARTFVDFTKIVAWAVAVRAYEAAAVEGLTRFKPNLICALIPR